MKQNITETLKPNLQINIPQKEETSDEKKNKLRTRILELIDLKNLIPRVMIPPQDNFERIIASLYYGFSNNIACYSGKGNKYIVKFSPKQGNLAKSSFDYIKKSPSFIIYNEFTVNKDMPDGSTLNIVSEISIKDFAKFIDFNELIKKI